MTFTTVKLDKARNIVLGFKAMQEFKNITGKSLTKINFEDEKLTLEKTIELIDNHLGVKGAIELIPKIISDAFGAVDSEKK